MINEPLLIDHHSHLQHEKFDEIREEVIQKSINKMAYVVVSGANRLWNRRAVEIFGNKDRFLITLGIHPLDAVKMNEKEFEQALEEIRYYAKEHNNIIGIGEIGLDYHWIKDEYQRKISKERFIQQIDIANELSLPIITHSWDADAEVLKIGVEYKKDLKIAMHCFSSYKIVNDVHEYGILAGICTNIVRNKSVKKSVKKLDLKNILTETDAPYLSPNPSEINYPWNVSVVVKKIADIKGVSVDEVEATVYENFIQFYGLLQ